MAVAEARAAWQRTVNRCLVQEDAKRAPKLAYCPSASLSIGEVDVGPRRTTGAEDIPSVGFLPFNWNTSYSNLSPNPRWWLQLQPSYRQQKVFTSEQNSIEDSEMKVSQIGVGPVSKPPDSHDGSAFVDDSMNTDSFIDSDFTTSNSNVKNDFGIENVECKPTCRGSLYESAEIGTDGCIASKKTNKMFPSESPWIGDEKAEPWWRIADQDELALFVVQRSFGLIENCDLPQPQNSGVKREGLGDLCSIDNEENCSSCADPKHSGHGFFACNENSFASEGERQKQWSPVDYYSQSSASSVTSLREGANQGVVAGRNMAESNSSRAELLEALCHSQTRAREAEKAAKQAYEEKEHVGKLVFKQASQLFAYKHWFQLVQLENLCFQIKNNKNQPISSLFPIMLPWVPVPQPQKAKKLRKSWQTGGRGKRGKMKKGRPICDITKYAVVFALGLSLVGAGLLLGWSVGWMFPTVSECLAAA